ncbi:tetratricopeptide repeat protein [Providencia burhodogranariea]|uniref:Sel1 repeat family protein n=1 Tax=Providencia burhodogranariea DSM 19968 TaxID=1141662 RepID=K8X2G0_9GAMM|nr:sel1 repeat family protein [Providencia burhodogranariea]EKT63852.1 hypothetical protein OOA_03284 [Providencia burhodogranariea DSM 19968]
MIKNKICLLFIMLLPLLSQANKLKNISLIVFEHHNEYFTKCSNLIPNNEKEYQELIQLAELGNADANWMYARIEDRWGNKIIAKERYLLSTQRRDNYRTSSIVNLGFIFQNEGDYAKSRDLFEIAGSEGDPRGYVAIGTNYLHGSGVNMSLNRARKYYIKAAELGDRQSQFMVDNWKDVVKLKRIETRSQSNYLKR